MSSINEYIHNDSDCETVYSYEDIEEQEEYDEEEYNDGDYEEEYDDEYYEPEYIKPKKEIIKHFRSNIDTKIPEINPWSKKNNEVIKTMAEIIKEEEEIKKIEEKKRIEMEKISKQRKERFRHSRSSFHFKNETESKNRKLLLKK